MTTESNLRVPSTMGGKTWFAIDGSLEPIEFAGTSFFRFPEELARLVLKRFSKPGDTILDPFCGFGTALVAAERLGRIAYGIEHDQERAAYASSRVRSPTLVIHDDVANLDRHRLPPMDLSFTSPPYTSFHDRSDDGFTHYWDDFETIFASFRSVLLPQGRLVVELSNVREADGRVRPVGFVGASRLARLYDFECELVRYNTGPERAGPGYDHSYIVVFAHN